MHRDPAVAPGLVELGIPTLTAHFFVFYYAVLSAITPPVALASYAAAGISGANPIETSITSFKIGLAAFVVPYMFFYNGALLMQGSWPEVAHVFVTAMLGVFLLAAAVQGWLFGRMHTMISGGWLSDAIGLGIMALAFAVQRGLLTTGNAARGAD